MTRKLLALSCAALGLLMLSAAYSPADARRGHGFSGARSFGARALHAGPRSHAGARFHATPRFHSRADFAHRPRIHRHLRRHRHIYLGAPIIYGGYSYAGCDWLRRRALHTGRGYWWDRYYACIYGDH